jgi:hypothetical protein
MSPPIGFGSDVVARAGVHAGVLAASELDQSRANRTDLLGEGGRDSANRWVCRVAGERDSGDWVAGLGLSDDLDRGATLRPPAPSR